MFSFYSRVPTVTADDLREMVASGEAPFLLDVREPFEHLLAAIDGSMLVPLGDLPAKYADLPKDVKIVVYCRSGARSAEAVSFLRERGFENAFNLEGGMISWNKQGQ